MTEKIEHDATCNKCGHEWIRTIKDNDFRNVKCPKCKNNGSISLREREVMEEDDDQD